MSLYSSKFPHFKQLLKVTADGVRGGNPSHNKHTLESAKLKSPPHKITFFLPSAEMSFLSHTATLGLLGQESI